MAKTNSKIDIRKLTYLAVLTALVIILQLAGSFIRLGLFSISLVLIPIVIGVAICGVGAGAWLGFVFGAVVLLSGDAAAFLQIDPFGTVVTVFAKGILCGLLAGIAYKLVAKLNRFVGVLVGAIVCPVVNTGVFLLGSRIFFYESIKGWASAEGVSAVAYMFLFLVGGNFLFELLFNVVLSPATVRIINLIDKKS
ncbi:MAG: ECF transporter S component [Clostridia bacterium]|nr:ECF transporter S component [Clostridia bacterium]